MVKLRALSVFPDCIEPGENPRSSYFFAVICLEFAREYLVNCAKSCSLDRRDRCCTRRGQGCTQVVQASCQGIDGAHLVG